MWQQEVKTKIQNQAILLNHIQKVSYYASKVLSGDSDNREGFAAAYYWKPNL